VQRFRKSNNYEMAVLMDRKREVNRQYNIRAIPTLLVIDAQGTVRQHWVGSRSEKDLREGDSGGGSAVSNRPHHAGAPTGSGSSPSPTCCRHMA
jgi:hypothetical protein